MMPFLFIKELGKKFNKDDIGVIAENKDKYFNVKTLMLKPVLLLKPVLSWQG